MADLARLHAKAEATWADLFAVCDPRTLAAAEKVCPAWCDPEDLANEVMTRMVEEEFGPLSFASLKDLISWLEAEVGRIAVDWCGTCVPDGNRLPLPVWRHLWPR